MSVSAIIVTRGDHNLARILDSLPVDWEVLVWNNRGLLQRWEHADNLVSNDIPLAVPDLGAYGRYAAIEYAEGDVIYVQDDDCIVRDPQAIVREWKRVWRRGVQGKSGVLNLHSTGTEDHLIASMPPSRTDYTDTVLIGWGAVFHRDAPERAFERWRAAGYQTDNRDFQVIGADFVFPMLTPHLRLDAEHEDLPWAHAPNRTWSMPGYEQKKQEFLRAARAVRDRG